MAVLYLCVTLFSMQCFSEFNLKLKSVGRCALTRVSFFASLSRNCRLSIECIPDVVGEGTFRDENSMPTSPPGLVAGLAVVA